MKLITPPRGWIKKQLGCTSTPPVRLRVMDRATLPLPFCRVIAKLLFVAKIILHETTVDWLSYWNVYYDKPTIKTAA